MPKVGKGRTAEIMMPPLTCRFWHFLRQIRNSA